MKIETTFNSQTVSKTITFDLMKLLKLDKNWTIDDITPSKEGSNYKLEVMASRSL